jgi:uncharacterized membrane-anchored protein YhcB (DUF1043 family)
MRYGQTEGDREIIIGLIIGIFIGTLVGALVMSIMASASHADDVEIDK